MVFFIGVVVELWLVFKLQLDRCSVSRIADGAVGLYEKECRCFVSMYKRVDWVYTWNLLRDERTFSCFLTGW